MSTKKKSINKALGVIALNRKAHHDYHLSEAVEAGLVLEGWEVKSLRAGKGQLSESYILLKAHEAWLFGAHISPLPTVAGHMVVDPRRTRKLLLHKRELNKLYGRVERKGFTVVPGKLYWKKNHIKVEIWLAKGKKEYDKRATLKEKDWQVEKARLSSLKNI